VVDLKLQAALELTGLVSSNLRLWSEGSGESAGGANNGQVDGCEELGGEHRELELSMRMRKRC
jgi:hypothetical protein